MNLQEIAYRRIKNIYQNERHKNHISTHFQNILVKVIAIFSITRALRPKYNAFSYFLINIYFHSSEEQKNRTFKWVDRDNFFEPITIFFKKHDIKVTKHFAVFDYFLPKKVKHCKWLKSFRFQIRVIISDLPRILFYICEVMWD